MGETLYTEYTNDWKRDETVFQLEVPSTSEFPTVLELAVALQKKIQREFEIAQGEILPAELDVANAQRIAIAKRHKAETLREALESFTAQIEAIKNSAANISAAA